MPFAVQEVKSVRFLADETEGDERWSEEHRYTLKHHLKSGLFRERRVLLGDPPTPANRERLAAPGNVRCLAQSTAQLCAVSTSYLP